MIEIKQVSSLDKIRDFSEAKTAFDDISVLKGESFSYQHALFSEYNSQLEFSIDSPLVDFINISIVKSVPVDMAYCGYGSEYEDNDYIIKKPGLMPDLLVPAKAQRNSVRFYDATVVLWIEVNLPKDFPSGDYSINIDYKGTYIAEEKTDFLKRKTLLVHVINNQISAQELMVSQWFHTDCIASAHNAEIYSEEHWELIDKYMWEASEIGMNMILTPVITPPLDTKPGYCRPNVQLVKIVKNGDEYTFDFSLLKRFIQLARKNGMKYFEISHFFSQWGLEYAPNVYVTENDEEKLIFGWDTVSNDEKYVNFLKALLTELRKFLENENVYENCYFHISDEPSLEHLENYRFAFDILKSIIGKDKILDAISDVEFYNTGLISVPVTATDHIEPFLEKGIENQWAYYCCVQGIKVANRFMSMPSYRNRILGVQLYKYGIKGFLQWGFNFYYSQLSQYKINPYVTTSADLAFPSGDAFLVYPGENGPLQSIRSKVFGSAVQDVALFKTLEDYVGKDKVIELIEKIAGMEITFSEYPRYPGFLIKVEAAVKNEIKRFS